MVDHLSGILGGGGVFYSFNTITYKDSVLFNFDTLLGYRPISSLIKASNGILYGMTAAGGDSNDGAIYAFNISLKVVVNEFDFYERIGYFPAGGNLMEASNGLLYGMTSLGGTTGNGVFFSFDPNTNTEIVLKDFNNSDGIQPENTPIQDPDNGLLYSTVYGGGSSDEGTLFSYDLNTSTFTKKIDFTGNNGAYPVLGLTLVKDSSILTGVNHEKIYTGIQVFPTPQLVFSPLLLVVYLILLSKFIMY